MTTVSLLMLAILAEGAPDVTDSSETQLREVIQRSIPYIETEGNRWIEERECMSCHRVGPMLWSLRAARNSGFEVSDQLGEWTDWSIESLLSENDKGQIVGSTNREGIAQLLLSLDQEEDWTSHREARDQLVKLALNSQNKNGTWDAGGQLPQQKRPREETNDVSTMWITLALRQTSTDSELLQAADSAVERIQQDTDAESTEWYVTQLLLSHQQADAPTTSKWIEQLNTHQHEDGSWGWLVGDPGDALGTGLALYALLRSGMDRNDPIVQRAQQFFIDTQQPDGSWPVKGTKEKAKDNIEETATYWGTTWATLALVTSLPIQ